MEHTSPTEPVPLLGPPEPELPEPQPQPGLLGLLQDPDRLATALAIALMALGFVFMGAAWYGASGKNEIQQQFPYLLSGGLPGLALALLGGGIVVVRDIRRERAIIEERMARLQELVEEVVSQGLRPPRGLRAGRGARGGGAGALGTGAPAAGGPANSQVVLGRSTFHLPACRLVAEKEGLPTASRSQALAAGLAPCRVCGP